MTRPNTKSPFKLSSPAFDSIELSVNNVQAIQTTRLFPHIDNTKNTRNFSGSSDSSSAFGAFNLGTHVNDNLNQVHANRAHLLHFLPPKSSIQWLEQVHENNVVLIEEVNAVPLKADAMITREKNIALAIMTADCLPILLANIQGTEIAAIHAGWRSLASGIITKTLHQMHSEPQEIIAWLGPCISQQKFEVGEEVKSTFVTLDKKNAQAFLASKNNKWMADLRCLAHMEINAYGVNVINKSENCTFSDPSRYYSYRKQTITGRMASVICLG